MIGIRKSLLDLASTTFLIISNSAHAQEGVWKYLVPAPGTMVGEFQNNDPLGLAAGAEIKADYSLYWIDPADEKMYCFSSGTSLQTFLDAPQTYIAQARRAWEKLHPADK
jgi:hypothetical protein